MKLGLQLRSVDQGLSIKSPPILLVCVLSHAQLFATPWTVAHWAPLSMGFPRQEYWSELPLLAPGDLSNPEIEPASPISAGRFSSTEPSLDLRPLPQKAPSKATSAIPKMMRNPG